MFIGAGLDLTGSFVGFAGLRTSFGFEDCVVGSILLGGGGGGISSAEVFADS